MTQLRQTVLLAILTATVVRSEPVGDCRPKNYWHQAELLPDDTDCEMFYECYSGYPTATRCRYGLRFNVKLQVCDWPWNVTCPGTYLLRRDGDEVDGSGAMDQEEDPGGLTSSNIPPDLWAGYSKRIHEEESATNQETSPHHEAHSEEAARHFFELSDAFSERIWASGIHEHVLKKNGKVSTEVVLESLFNISETVQRATEDAVVKYTGHFVNTSAGHTITNFLKNFSALVDYFDPEREDAFEAVQSNEAFQSFLQFSTNNPLKAIGTAPCSEEERWNVDEHASNYQNKPDGRNDQGEMHSSSSDTDHRNRSHPRKDVGIGDIFSMLADMKQAIQFTESVSYGAPRAEQEGKRKPPTFLDTYWRDDSTHETDSIENEELKGRNYKFLVNDQMVSLELDEPTRSETSDEEAELTKKTYTSYLENRMRSHTNEKEKNEEAKVETQRFLSEDKSGNSELDDISKNESQQKKPEEENIDAAFLEDRMGIIEDETDCDNDTVIGSQPNGTETTGIHEKERSDAVEKGPDFQIDSERITNGQDSQNEAPFDHRLAAGLKAPSILTAYKDQVEAPLPVETTVFDNSREDGDGNAPERENINDGVYLSFHEKQPDFYTDFLRTVNSQNSVSIDARKANHDIANLTVIEKEEDFHSYSFNITKEEDSQFKVENYESLMPYHFPSIKNDCDDDGLIPQENVTSQGTERPATTFNPTTQKVTQTHSVVDTTLAFSTDSNITPQVTTLTGEDHTEIRLSTKPNYGTELPTEPSSTSFSSEGTTTLLIELTTDSISLTTGYGSITQSPTAVDNLTSTESPTSVNTDQVTTTTQSTTSDDGLRTTPGEQHTQTVWSTVVNGKTEAPTETPPNPVTTQTKSPPIAELTTEFISTEGNSITKHTTDLESTILTSSTENPTSPSEETSSWTTKSDESSNTSGLSTLPTRQEEDSSATPTEYNTQTVTPTSVTGGIETSTETNLITNERTHPPTSEAPTEYYSTKFITNGPTDVQPTIAPPTTRPPEETDSVTMSTSVTDKIQPTTEIPPSSITERTFPTLNELTTEYLSTTSEGNSNTKRTTDFETTIFTLTTENPTSPSEGSTKPEKSSNTLPISTTPQTIPSTVVNGKTEPPTQPPSTYFTTNFLPSKGSPNTVNPSVPESTIIGIITENPTSLAVDTTLVSNKTDDTTTTTGFTMTPVDEEHTSPSTTTNPLTTEYVSYIIIDVSNGSKVTTSQETTEPTQIHQKTELPPSTSTKDYTDLKTTNSIVTLESITTDANTEGGRTTFRPGTDSHPSTEYVETSTTTGAIEFTTTLQTDTVDVSCPSFADGNCFSRPWNHFPKNLAHITDCSLYFQCVGDTPVLKHCPKGLHFSRFIGRCDTPHQARCVSHHYEKDSSGVCPPTIKPDPRCGDCQRQGPLFPHPDDCSRYLICWRGTVNERRCRYGMHFNPKSAMCDFPFRACCSLSSRLRPMCKTKKKSFKECSTQK